MVGGDGYIAVYIIASGLHGKLYIGVTSDLARCADEHRGSTGWVWSFALLIYIPFVLVGAAYSHPLRSHKRRSTATPP
jgi:hypothetical protein